MQSDIQIVGITSENLSAFRGLMPDYIADRVENGVLLGFGSVCEKEAVGVIVLGLNTEQFDLTHLFVNENFRGRGVGNELVLQAMLMAEKYRIPLVASGAGLKDEEAFEQIMDTYGFIQEETQTGVVRFCVKDVFQIALFEKEMTGGTLLSEITDPEFELFIRKENLKSYSILHIGEKKKNFLPDVSAVVKQDTEIRSCLLFTQDDGELYIYYLLLNPEAAGLDLIRMMTVILPRMKKYEQIQKVTAACINPSALTMVKKLIPNAEILPSVKFTYHTSGIEVM